MNAAKPTAIKIKKAVLPWLLDNGIFEKIVSFPLIKAEIGDFTVFYRTPSTGSPPESQPRDEMERAARKKYGPEILPYEMEIFYRAPRF